MEYGHYPSAYPQSHQQQQSYFTPGEMQFSQFSYDQGNTAPTQSYGSSYPSNMFTPSLSAKQADVEDFENEPPLLEELGINFSHITEKTISVLMPYRESTQEVLEDADLAGPLVFCLIFGCTLLLAGKVHFNYIYGLGVFGCLGIYLLLTMMTPNGVTPTRVASTLGYCLLPMCLLSSLGILVSLNLRNSEIDYLSALILFEITDYVFLDLTLPGILVTVAVVLWCAISSSKLFVRALDMQHQRMLIAYPCALVYSVFALLVVF